MPHASAELRAELRAKLDALADASAHALEQLRAGDEAGVRQLVERRERLLEDLVTWSLETDEAIMEAARRAVALDTELVAAMRLQLTGMDREVGDVMRTRRSLISYGATPARSPVFVERLG